MRNEGVLKRGRRVGAVRREIKFQVYLGEKSQERFAGGSHLGYN